MADLQQFYILSHISIAFIGGVLLLALWYNINRNFKHLLDEEDNRKRLDKGLVYISLSLFVWVISGLWALLTAQVGWDQTFIERVGINILSTLNNLCLLLALFYFLEAPGFIYRNPKNVRKLILAIISIAVLSLFLALIDDNAPRMGMVLGNIPDLLLSGFLTFVLMTTLYRTFIHRGLPLVAVLAVIVLGFMFMSQLPEVFYYLNDTFSDNLIKLISKTALIFIFLVLATSWVIQLAHTPSQSEMTLEITDWSEIRLSIPSKKLFNQRVDFGSKVIQFKNLLKFAIRRKYASGSDQCLTVSAGGEIKSQTYLTRIIDNMNEIMEMKADGQLARKDLFTFVGQSQYRLRFLPEHITISDALLQEFIQDNEHTVYAHLVQTSKD